MVKNLCDTCVSSIWCPSWTEYKCKVKQRRILGPKQRCRNYKKRDKDFKEPKCQCSTCLENTKLYEEDYE